MVINSIYTSNFGSEQLIDVTAALTCQLKTFLFFCIFHFNFMPRLTRKQNYIALIIVMVNSFTNPRIKPSNSNILPHLAMKSAFCVVLFQNSPGNMRPCSRSNADCQDSSKQLANSLLSDLFYVTETLNNLFALVKLHFFMVKVI